MAKNPQPKQLELFDPQSKQRKMPVGVTLSPSDIAMIDAIQARTGLTRSAAIRACIQKVYSTIGDL